MAGATAGEWGLDVIMNLSVVATRNKLPQRYEL